MERWIEMFMPGRLCLFGEHSDWAATYRKKNSKINKGYSIVLGLDKGIYLKACKSENFEYTYGGKKISIDNVMNNIETDSFFDYVLSAARVMTENYLVKGVNIICTDMTLPMKKGLGSSAAICMSIVRIYNLLYSLQITIEEEMELAYKAEKLIGSKCGRMDQLCAYGKGIRLVKFDGNNIESEIININKEMYYLLVDLKGDKNTKKILEDLNVEYPVPRDERAKKLFKTLGKDNEIINLTAKEYIETGKLTELGILMNKAQENFKKNVSIYSEQLKSPKLNELISFTKEIKEILGVKGVGSQGDGMAQILVTSKKDLNKIKGILREKYNYYIFDITVTNEIVPAIIPIAGKATRMKPYSDLVDKVCLPIYHNGKILPAIYLILEELKNAGIQNVDFIIRENQIRLFKKILEYCKQYKLPRITYSLQNKFGFGGALSSSSIIDKEKYSLICLGDYIYKTSYYRNCTRQLIDAWKIFNGSIISIKTISPQDTKNYGVISGKWVSDNIIRVERIIEKPEMEYALRELTIEKNNRHFIYGVFGEYILDNRILQEIHMMNDVQEEIGLTEFLDKNINIYPIYAAVIKGESFDLGNPIDFYNSFVEYGKENN